MLYKKLKFKIHLWYLYTISTKNIFKKTYKIKFTGWLWGVYHGQWLGFFVIKIWW